MGNSTQTRNFLLAGTLTSLVVVVFFVFGSPLLARNSDGATAVADEMALALDTMETHNAELTAAVEAYEKREATYRLQLESVNATIQQLQGDTSLSQANSDLLNQQSQGLVQTLEEATVREEQYLAAIEAANVTIQQLESDANALTTQYAGQIGELQAQNGEMAQLLQLMQSREAEYQAQINLANQTIQELQAANASYASASPAGGHGEHEGHGEDDD